MPTKNQPATEAGRGEATAGHGVGSKQRAAQRAVRRTSAHITLPVVGEVILPPPGHLAWYAGVAALAAAELIEWPIAAVLAVGKALADSRSNRTVEEFGKALEEAG